MKHTEKEVDVLEENRKAKRTKRMEKANKRRKKRLSKDELFERKWN